MPNERDIDRRTVLKATGCDVRRLPLGAREAFFLSQLDGQLTLEEIASIAGLELDEAGALADRLVTLGAVTPSEPPRRVERPRVDPRAEPSPPPRRPTPRPERRRSRKSLRMQRPEPCELDGDTQKAIEALAAKVGKSDHYALLGVERDAEKKAIKRAYYGLAAAYHPDRFFGKKLGPLRASVERIFHAITEAHDVLITTSKRADYDATLPPWSRPKPSIKPEPKPSIKPEPKPSKRPSTAAPRKTVAPKRSSKAMRAPSRSAMKAAEVERQKRVQASAREIAVQSKVEVLVKAAEEALRKDDVISAANNYRLALAHRDDLYLRIKYEEVDARARIVRFEKNIEPARIAERDERWADAAVFLLRAHDAKPEASVAARAAHALRRSGGDLDRATVLAEQAVAADEHSIPYRITLGEVHLAARRYQRAEEACEEVLLRAPKDARAKDLAAAIARARKASS